MKSYLTVTSQCAALGNLVRYEARILIGLTKRTRGVRWRSAALPLGSRRCRKSRNQLRRSRFSQKFFNFEAFSSLAYYQPMKLFLRRKNCKLCFFKNLQESWGVGGGNVLAGLFCSIDLWPTKEMSTYETQINATRLRKCKQRCEKIIQSLVFYGI